VEFTAYQNQAGVTARYPAAIGLLYVALGLAGEVGEVANKIKKVYRDSGGEVTEASRAAIADEAADCLWYLAMLCTELDICLDDVAQANLAKLASRQARGVIHGTGDNR
jgi:NTP pyrophosphatase (non-canonical NTP hydrolase)